MKDLSSKDLPELKVEDILGDEEARDDNRASHVAYGTADCLKGKNLQLNKNQKLNDSKSIQNPDAKDYDE